MIETRFEYRRRMAVVLRRPQYDDRIRLMRFVALRVFPNLPIYVVAVNGDRNQGDDQEQGAPFDRPYDHSPVLRSCPSRKRFRASKSTGPSLRIFGGST